MVVDFHTHIFPDKIAPKALSFLSENCGQEPAIDGTARGLLALMEESGIDVSVVLPVLTDPRQFGSAFRFAVKINEENEDSLVRKRTGIISFAGIHPDNQDIKEKIRSVAREGIKGIKLHPCFQRVRIDDLRYLRIIEAATEEGLIVLTHAGYDPSTPGEKWCTPDMILNVLRSVGPERLILAHMGSNLNYQESYEKLCGQDVYLDTAYCLMDISAELFVRMVQKHGADRILFGSDCPFGQPKAFREYLQQMEGLSEEQKELILGTNARRLLGLS